MHYSVSFFRNKLFFLFRCGRRGFMQKKLEWNTGSFIGMFGDLSRFFPLCQKTGYVKTENSLTSFTESSVLHYWLYTVKTTRIQHLPCLLFSLYFKLILIKTQDSLFVWSFFKLLILVTWLLSHTSLVNFFDVQQWK